MSAPLNRSEYAAVYGPTAGDRLRLGDTGLVLEIPMDDSDLMGGLQSGADLATASACAPCRSPSRWTSW